MKYITIVIVALSMIVSSANAQNETIITTEMLKNIKSVSNLSLSPDGKLIAFRESGNILINNTKKDSPKKIIANGSGITWSSSSDAIAFLASEKETGKLQIFRYDLINENIHQITYLESGVNYDTPSWSKKNKITFTAIVPLGTIENNIIFNKPIAASQENSTPLILNQDAADGYASSGILPGANEPGLRVEEFVNEFDALY